jgi:hypothetical protein
VNPGPPAAPGTPARHARTRPRTRARGRGQARERAPGGRHEGRWRGSALTFRLAGAATVSGVAALAVAVTGWTPGSIGVLAGAVTALAAILKGSG